VICVVCAFSLATLLYFRNKKNTDIPGAVVKGMFVLRFLSISFILLLLLNVFLKQLKNETQNPVILLAIDNSRSIIANADSGFIKTEFAGKLRQLSEQVNKNFSVKTILFGGVSKAGENNPDYSEKETDINNLINDVENNYSNQNVGALILVSDGIYNKGANPVYNSEKLGYPIYTVAMGDTNELKDVAVQKINHNQFAYLGNIFPVEAVINAKKYVGKEVTVSLTANGTKKAGQKLNITTENFLANCNFTLSADVGGVQKYTINVTVMEGEKNISNNAQSFLIDVIDNRYKVLFLANFPHPDVSAIREVVSNNSSYELKFSMAGDFKESLKPYSLVIIHGYSNGQSGFITECKKNNIPFWIINPYTTENLNGLQINASYNKQNDAEAVLNTSFGLFTISDDLKRFIKELPAIKTFFGNYSVSNGSSILISQKIGIVETENPILIFNELGGLKSAVFVGDGLWRWKMRDFAEHNNLNLFTELISKCIQYLSVKSDKSFFRVIAPKIINENEPAEIGAEVYNKSYELIAEPSVSLTLTNPEKKLSNFNFSKLNNMYKLNLGYLPAGEYKYEAKVKVNNEFYSKQGTIIVKEIVAEKINTVANHQLLNQLSSKTGGKLFYPDQLEKLKDEILKNQLIKPITYSSNETTLIIDLKWLFYIILLLLSVEWFFRKRYAVI